MTSTSENSAIGALEEQALQWHVRLHSGSATEQDWLAFTDWLEADPAHNDAYTGVALTWEASKHLKDVFENERAPQTDNVVAFPFHRLRQAIKTKPLVFGGGFGAAIAATLLVLMAPVFLGQNGMPNGINYATGVGEQRTVALADGSTVILNTNSSITVRMDKQVRNIALNHGEAFFTVKHEKQRAFIVAANDLNIRDVGTQFDVRMDADRTLVSVTQGIVELLNQTQNQALADQPLRLVKGQQAVRDSSNKISIQAFDSERATTWRQGYLVFENTELPKVIAELNRYFERPIRLVDVDTSKSRFSGILQIADQDRAVRDIAALESLSVAVTDFEIILKPDSQIHQ